MIDPLPAIVAASGPSTRMGRSKALLDAGGRSFLARIVKAFHEGGADPILVVVRDPEGPEGREAQASGALAIHNPDPSPGPIASLQAGIRSLPTTVAGTFFCPVDHPLFLSGTVAELSTAFHQSGAPIVAPTWEGRRGHPVLFARGLFPELLEETLPHGARSVVRRYLESRVQIPVGDPGILVDIDTPEDYRRHFHS